MSNKLASIDFRLLNKDQLEESIAQFKWLNPPQQYFIDPDKGFCIIPKENSDYWHKTYQTPPANNSSGHALLYDVPTYIKSWKCTIEFSLHPELQYDHGGIMVYINDTHWLKAGLELEAGAIQMSCVTTNYESDWNYLQWLSTAPTVKVAVTVKRYETVCECLVEYEDENGDWTFLRESPLRLPSKDASVSVGPMCCAPKKEGSKGGMECHFYAVHIVK